MQAPEALKLAIGIGEPLIGRYLVYYALQGRFHLVEMNKNPDCPLCGERPTIQNMSVEGERSGKSAACGL